MLANLAAVLATIPAPVALAPTEPAPTDVQLAWASAEHRNFAVTWDEAGDYRNRIDIEPVDGEPANLAGQFTEPGQPNRVVLDTGLFDVDYRIRGWWSTRTATS
uniref:hypothetical protein n=1 Tax=Paractinoplanes polyasparticus TaxID=2856853 RepID=UPI001C85BBE0|nr:hypothetical protein [Actinoplanes polyasparticus]